MKVYKTIEFTKEDLEAIRRVQGLTWYIDKYDLRDEFDFCSFISFTGDLDRLLKYAESHVERAKK